MISSNSSRRQRHDYSDISAVLGFNEGAASAVTPEPRQPTKPARQQAQHVSDEPATMSKTTWDFVQLDLF